MGAEKGGKPLSTNHFRIKKADTHYGIGFVYCIKEQLLTQILQHIFCHSIKVKVVFPMPIIARISIVNA